MSFLSSASGLAFGTLIPFLFVLTLVVFVHELGHFWVARRVGVVVKVFSVGFGPELAGWTDRHGTRWRIAAVPLGGYVRFAGDEDAASRPDTKGTPVEGSLQAAPLAARAAVVAAGPVANFIFAAVVFSAVFLAFGRPMVAPVATDIEPGSAAAEAGFKPGDRIVGIDGESVESFADVQRLVMLGGARARGIDVDRDGTTVHLVATPRYSEITDGTGNRHRVPVLGLRQTNPKVEVKSFGPLAAIAEGTRETWRVAETNLVSIAGLFTGATPAGDLSGPIGIARVSGEVAALGILPLISLAAVLSVSIGLFNLFPIPLLDGGHLLFYAAEAVLRRPLPARTVELGYGVGLAIVLGLMAFGAFNDIVRIVAS